MDWNDLKIALAIARLGSLSAAARALGTTQPTVSRRLAGFERKTGVKLFERGKDGLTPTQLGAALTDGLDLMDEGALAVERRIASRDTGLQGPICWCRSDLPQKCRLNAPQARGEGRPPGASPGRSGGGPIIDAVPSGGRGRKR